jgi:hypothetical protein
MIVIILIVVASGISSGLAVLSWWKVRQTERKTAQHLLDAGRHGEAAQKAASASQACSESASRAALASKAHASVSLAHSLSVKKVVSAPSVQPSELSLGEIPEAVSQIQTPIKTRRELVAEAARSPENEARVAEIDELRARTSPLIPVDSSAQGKSHAKWRERVVNKR